MCGLLFVDQKDLSISNEQFQKVLFSQRWRGPDDLSFKYFNNSRIMMGHNRLSIIDEGQRSNQPFSSEDDKFEIIFNGEIYNFLEIKKKLNLITRTQSDTEIILKGYQKIGLKILDYLEGMFAFIIFNKKENNWIAARDPFGIKPLYFYNTSKLKLLGSESGLIGNSLNLAIDYESIDEWRLFRNPAPGYTFFKNLLDFPKGSYYLSGSNKFCRYWNYKNQKKSFYSQSKVEQIVKKSIESHEIGDQRPVSLISGGIDSSIINLFSNRVKKTYSVGLEKNNEFDLANKTAKILNKSFKKIIINNDQLIEAWKYLTRIRCEPLSVPNEGLIYLVCKSMSNNEKVILTGEGADELFFGYDRIFRWGINSPTFDLKIFIDHYCYNNNKKISKRMLSYIEECYSTNNSTINFLENFFIDFHLPVLLRRMDFSSMAASKEARVPFVTKELMRLLYNQNHRLKIDDEFSKKPLRAILCKSKINHVLNNKKIGFSSKIKSTDDKFKEYNYFQKIVLEELNWL